MVVQWWLLISWIRLFEGLSFYVILIIETIKDIAYFVIMFLICIAMFASAMMILNQERFYVPAAPTNTTFVNASGNSTIDTFVNLDSLPFNSTARILKGARV